MPSTPIVSQKYFYIRPAESFKVLAVSPTDPQRFILQRRNGSANQLWSYVRSRKRILRHVATNTFVTIDVSSSTVALSQESLLTWRFDSGAKLLKTSDSEFALKIDLIPSEGEEPTPAGAPEEVNLTVLPTQDALQNTQCFVELRYLLPKVFLFKLGDALLHVNAESTDRVNLTNNAHDENTLWYRDDEGRIFNLNTGAGLKVNEEDNSVTLMDEGNASSFEWLSNGHVRVRDQPESALCVKESQLIVASPHEASSFVIQFIEPCQQEEQHTTEEADEPTSENTTSPNEKVKSTAEQGAEASTEGDENQGSTAPQDEDNITTTQPPMESPTHKRQAPEVNNEESSTQEESNKVVAEEQPAELKIDAAEEAETIETNEKVEESAATEGESAASEDAVPTENMDQSEESEADNKKDDTPQEEESTNDATEVVVDETETKGDQSEKSETDIKSDDTPQEETSTNEATETNEDQTEESEADIKSDDTPQEEASTNDATEVAANETETKEDQSEKPEADIKTDDTTQEETSTDEAIEVAEAETKVDEETDNTPAEEISKNNDTTNSETETPQTQTEEKNDNEPVEEIETDNTQEQAGDEDTNENPETVDTVAEEVTEDAPPKVEDDATKKPADEGAEEGSDATTHDDETKASNAAKTQIGGSRIQNQSNQLFIEIDFAGAPEEMPKDGSIRLIVQTEKDSWTQRFTMENGFITNLATGLRVSHGAQENAFAVMLPPAENDNKQVWSKEGQCLISAHDKLGLTTAADEPGAQLDIRPFDVSNPPSDCNWGIVSDEEENGKPTEA
eukprot:CAMPEP_0117449456 /NCGR_PEP_ID=MMETSP0759-20121206/7955_1 /TAXON_ID=63605 /ORGANISM="Percolomonas cosmopolitus, Strain WS" /LENGTH=797 /DNA_ID=CAMNT_0005241933 /DNA_START=119 /DNA_END=2512 /DNA_ORIENTATION=-